MRIKGRYVCTVEIDIDFLREKEMLSFEEIKDKTINGWLTDSIKDVIVGEIMDSNRGKTTVTQQYADLYEVREEEGADG